MNVAKSVPHANRRLELGITMHQAVAKLPVDEQAGWLDRAIENGWDRATLRDAIAGRAADAAYAAVKGLAAVGITSDALDVRPGAMR